MRYVRLRACLRRLSIKLFFLKFGTLADLRPSFEQLRHDAKFRNVLDLPEILLRAH